MNTHNWNKHSFTLYDINSKKELENEIEYLVNRLHSLMKLCSENNIEINEYVYTILGVKPNK